jgi:anti-sigma regulatory factor (Ser/Thr protein kinase)
MSDPAVVDVLASDLRLELRVAAAPAAVAQLRGRAAEWLAERGVGQCDLDQLKLVITEAAGNAVRHAYPDGDGDIEVTLELDGDAVHLAVVDHGQWRSPDGRPLGWGLMLIHELSDCCGVETGANGTVVRAVLRPLA